MEHKSKTEEFAEAVFGTPLEPLSRREIEALYGREIKSIGRLIGRTLARRRAADLVVSFAYDAGRAAMKIVDAVGDVVANIVDTALPMPVQAYAIRGLGGAAVPGAVRGAGRIEAKKEGDGATLKVSIEDSAGRCDVRIRIEDSVTGGMLSPMDLYIEDMEDGSILLKRTPYASGEAILHGVEPGEYWIEADCGGKSAEIALKVEGAAR